MEQIMNIRDRDSLHERNRRLLAKGWTQRLQVEIVQDLATLIALVDSSSCPGACYKVYTDLGGDWHCACEWGTVFGSYDPASMAAPCKHILLTIWQRLPAAEQARRLGASAILRAAAAGMGGALGQQAAQAQRTADAELGALAAALYSAEAAGQAPLEAIPATGDADVPYQADLWTPPGPPAITEAAPAPPPFQTDVVAEAMIYATRARYDASPAPTADGTMDAYLAARRTVAERGAQASADLWGN